MRTYLGFMIIPILIISAVCALVQLDLTLLLPSEWSRGAKVIAIYYWVIVSAIAFDWCVNE